MIVFLHGAFFVHSFGRQYPLAEKYHIAVPHIMGYGKDAARTFQTETAIRELADYIREQNRKVVLIGFSLGAQLAAELIVRHEELFRGAILISPWLKKTDAETEVALKQNLKQWKSMKNRLLCGLIGRMNGLPKEQRKEFLEQMQEVSEETVRNSVNTGIDLDGLGGFADLKIPVIALAGEKEGNGVKESVITLERMNERCRAEIRSKAGHNIPPLFHKRLNTLIEEFMKNEADS